MISNGKIDNVQAFGVTGNLSRKRVIDREIGRFKSRETIPSCDFPKTPGDLSSSTSYNPALLSIQNAAVNPVRLVFFRTDSLEKAVDHKIIFKRHAQFAGDSTLDHCFLHHA